MGCKSSFRTCSFLLEAKRNLGVWWDIAWRNEESHFAFVHHDVRVDNMNERNGVRNTWDGGAKKLGEFVSH